MGPRGVVVVVRVETSKGKVATFPIQITCWCWDLNQWLFNRKQDFVHLHTTAGRSQHLGGVCLVTNLGKVSGTSKLGSLWHHKGLIFRTQRFRTHFLHQQFNNVTKCETFNEWLSEQKTGSSAGLSISMIYWQQATGAKQLTAAEWRTCFQSHVGMKRNVPNSVHRRVRQKPPCPRRRRHGAKCPDA